MKYRSKYEQQVHALLGSTVEYEKSVLEYTIPESKHCYTPDFHIPGTNIYIETKGRFCVKDRMKQLLIKKQHPDKRIILVFMNPNEKLRKGSKTSYLDWCNKNDIEVMTVTQVKRLIK